MTDRARDVGIAWASDVAAVVVDVVAPLACSATRLEKSRSEDKAMTVSLAHSGLLILRPPSLPSVFRGMGCHFCKDTMRKLEITLRYLRPPLSASVTV